MPGRLIGRCFSVLLGVSSDVGLKTFFFCCFLWLLVENFRGNEVWDVGFGRNVVVSCFLHLYIWAGLKGEFGL